MVTLNSGSMSLLLISCVLSTSVSLPALAGDGVIVIGRNVQGHMAGRSSFAPDPYPTTVNVNPAAQVLRATSGELSDNDIAGVSSGSTITRAILPNGNLPGLSTSHGTSSSTLGAGAAAGHGGGGSSISGQINGSIQRGMAPLSNIGSMMGAQQ
ncbi:MULTISPECIES: hypothetical protein [unclassified Pseudomonas]|uniref:hypothetical protein n=1 Tax=unclassified Pseudomonas TaxID=196821 RepID=UPI0011ECE976|nr:MULTISPECIES: hypothetical protein [unclassified Pseudomonas]KAA0942542.1 hypothetical protein FQ182_27295 [Pseudomonas sp. ANT_H4]KAA0948030.1 hypothetical protein FQ186_24025 [Pseudomonas sp. ANT_H14]